MPDTKTSSHEKSDPGNKLESVPRSDNTNAAIIDRSYNWLPISKKTPRGRKIQLINDVYGVACYGVLSTNEHYFTHWAPLPTFD